MFVFVNSIFRFIKNTFPFNWIEDMIATQFYHAKYSAVEIISTRNLLVTNFQEEESRSRLLLRE